MGKAQRRKQDRPSAPPAAPAAPRAAAPGRSSAPSRPLARLLGPLLIVAVGVVCYANSFSIPFLLDDRFDITNNPAVTAVESPLAYLTRSRGIPALTFALNYRWGGFDVWGFHLVNVLVHLCNALLVYALVRHTLALPFFAGRYRQHGDTLAVLVALMFVAHPLQTMAASYLVQRAESLAAVCYLGTLLLFVRGVAAQSPGARAGWLAGALAVAALGVLSKESVATVPLAALLYYACFLAAQYPLARRTRLVLVLLLMAPLAYGLWLARLYLVPAAGGDPTAPRTWLYIPTAGFSVEGVSSWRYLLTQFGVVVWYLGLFLLPTAQCFDYGWPFVDSPWRADVLLPLAVLLALVGAAVVAVRRHRLTTFCLGWVFVTLAPTSSIVPLRDAAFEHRMYLPIVGLAWLAIVGGYDLLAWLVPRQQRTPALWRAAAAAAGLWVALLAVATVARNQVLRDPLALAQDDVAKAPGNWRPYYALADGLLQQQRTDDAIAALETAVRLGPDHGAPRVQLGSLYVQRKRYDDAQRVLEPATALLEESVVASALSQLAVVYLAQGDDGGAEAALLRAEQLEPGWSSLQRQLGVLYTRRGLWIEAARHYEEAIKLTPKLAATLAPAAAQANLRAAVEFQTDGKSRVAVVLLEKALHHQPQLTAARHYLAFVLSGLGESQRAEAEMARVGRERPDDPVVRDNLERARNGQRLSAPAVDAAAS